MLCMPVFLVVRWKTILAWDSTSHGGKMPEGYLHLTCEQRCQIYALLQSGLEAHIARQIGVDPSTISRELVRNTGARGYRFKQAHEKASPNFNTIKIGSFWRLIPLNSGPTKYGDMRRAVA